jgi:methanogenic corrinoid protein MtbC1
MSRKKIKHHILNNKEKLIDKIMDEQFKLMPELKAKYNEKEVEKSKSDTSYNLNYLAQAVLADEVKIFSNYYNWLHTVLKERGIGVEILITHLEAIKNILETEFSVEDFEIISDYLTAAAESLEKPENHYQSFITETNDLSKEAEEYFSFLLDMEREKAVNFILNLVENGITVEDIYLKIFQPTQYEIGRYWQLNKVSVAQEHYATSVTQLAMSQLYPKIFNSFKKGKKALTTCIGYELHELGIRMVADLLELNGWDTIHLGSNTPPAEILDIIEEKEINLLALSATLPNELEEIKNLIKIIRQNSQLEQLKVMVGGRIFMQSDKLWQKIGADRFAIDAKEAVKVADSFL